MGSRTLGWATRCALFASHCLVLASLETQPAQVAFIRSSLCNARNSQLNSYFCSSEVRGAHTGPPTRPSMAIIRRKDGESNSRFRKLRARGLNFKDARTSEAFQDMPVELIKSRPQVQFRYRTTKTFERQPSPETPAEFPSGGIGESYWMEYTMRVSCDVCEKKEDPAKPLEDLERAYLDGAITAAEFEEKKQLALKNFWASLVSEGSIKRSIKTKSVNLQVPKSSPPPLSRRTHPQPSARSPSPMQITCLC
jgi:hypothetical protein